MIGDVVPGQVYESFSKNINEKGEHDLTVALDEIWEKIVPGMCHWSHPHNIAWFPNVHPRIRYIHFHQLGLRFAESSTFSPVAFLCTSFYILL